MVRVLLKLAERFQVELSALAPEDDERLSSNLLEVFSDPSSTGPTSRRAMCGTWSPAYPR